MTRLEATARFSFAILAASLLLHSRPAGAGETLVDEQLGFTLVIPDGFVARPEIVNANPGMAHAYTMNDPMGGEYVFFLAIETLSGPIGPERTRREQLPADFQGRLFVIPWAGFEVNAFEIPEISDLQPLTFNVQIPLKAHAIQVQLAGRADRETELKQLLSEILAGLEGESNWSDLTVPNAAPAKWGIGPILLLVGYIVALGIGVAFLLVVRRTMPKWTVFALAFGSYMAGTKLLELRPEMKLAGSTLHMLAGIGVAIGIVNLFLRGKSRNEKPTSGNPQPLADWKDDLDLSDKGQPRQERPRPEVLPEIMPSANIATVGTPAMTIVECPHCGTTVVPSGRQCPACRNNI